MNSSSIYPPVLILMQFDPIYQWLLDNFPPLGVLAFVILCVYKSIVWINSFFAELEAKSNKTKSKFQKTRTQFEKLEAHLTQHDVAIDKLEKTVDRRFDKMDTRIDRIETVMIAILESNRKSDHPKLVSASTQ